MPEAYFSSYYYSYFKNHVLDFLVPRDCSVSDSLLELYCQEPSWPLALSTENAALKRMNYSFGKASGGGRGYQDWQ